MAQFTTYSHWMVPLGGVHAGDLPFSARTPVTDTPSTSARMRAPAISYGHIHGVDAAVFSTKPALISLTLA